MIAHAVDAALRPRAVAVVGASADPSKRGHQVLQALVGSTYAGRVYPVNPRGGTLLGLEVHSSLEALPGRADLALVCTPARTVPDVVASCGRAGIPVAVLLAVGFGESGREGRGLERAVVAAGRDHGVRLVGPNTSGLINLTLGLNLIGAPGVRSGHLGLVAQSGNVALELMLEARRRSAAGFSICVGVGNEVDLGFPDFVAGLCGDEATHAVLVHAEGFRRGAEFLAVVAETARRKPVVLLKGARAPAAAEAARSHTGVVAGSYAALRAALRQAGVVQVARSDELFHVGEALASQPPVPAGRGVAVLTDGGGQGTLAVDALEEIGVQQSRLSEGTRAALRELLGPAAAVDGPVDLAGAADAAPAVFSRCVAILLEDPDVGAVLVVGLFGGYATRFNTALADAEEDAAVAMARLAADAGVALVVHSMYAPDGTPPLLRLREAGVPVVESLEVAARVVGALVERGRHLARPAWRPSSPPPSDERGDLRVLDEPEARGLLGEAGLPLVPATLCADPDAAATAARETGGAVAVKAVAAGVVHKTDVGAVALGVAGDREVREAFARVTRAAVEAGAAAGGVRGVLVSPMLPPPLAELLLGARRDRGLGTVLTLAAGGTWVEHLGDASLRLLPVDAREVRAMLAELRIEPMLTGARGRPAADLDAVVDAALALARLMEARPEVVEAELNPLFVTPSRAVGVDARVVVRGG